MTRVIGGTAGGRRLAVPRGTSTRPTSDRAREGLFASVQSELGSLAGKRVLDLYAGSGAVGLEALSRGAGHVLLVESDARTAAVIKANVAAIGITGATVVTDRAERLLGRDRGRGDADADTARRRLAGRRRAGRGGARHPVRSAGVAPWLPARKVAKIR
jgi:16S rRNA (guanine966-N2)-methyltransferase